MNIKIKASVASALRKYAFESTGQMRGVSDIAEKAIREYLEKRGVVIEPSTKNESGDINPREAIPALAFA